MLKATTLVACALALLGMGPVQASGSQHTIYVDCGGRPAVRAPGMCRSTRLLQLSTPAGRYRRAIGLSSTWPLGPAAGKRSPLCSTTRWISLVAVCRSWMVKVSRQANNTATPSSRKVPAPRLRRTS